MSNQNEQKKDNQKSVPVSPAEKKTETKQSVPKSDKEIKKENGLFNSEMRKFTIFDIDEFYYLCDKRLIHKMISAVPSKKYPDKTAYFFSDEGGIIKELIMQYRLEQRIKRMSKSNRNSNNNNRKSGGNGNVKGKRK